MSYIRDFALAFDKWQKAMSIVDIDQSMNRPWEPNPAVDAMRSAEKEMERELSYIIQDRIDETIQTRLTREAFVQ